MNARDEQRLNDILASLAAIQRYLVRGGLSDGLIFDAVRIRLIEIGEAAKVLPPEVTATEPDIPWRDIARMRDYLAHRYFDTDHSIVEATVLHDLPALTEAVQRLLVRRQGGL